jgi:hypothetical protein
MAEDEDPYWGLHLEEEEGKPAPEEPKPPAMTEMQTIPENTDQPLTTAVRNMFRYRLTPRQMRRRGPLDDEYTRKMRPLSLQLQRIEEELQLIRGHARVYQGMKRMDPPAPEHMVEHARIASLRGKEDYWMRKHLKIRDKMRVLDQRYGPPNG